MTIDDKLLEKLENLSAIKIDDDKKESIKSELNDILNFVENLNKMDMQEKLNIKYQQTYTKSYLYSYIPMEVW